ncbi:hypothetical protein GCM10011487_37180 [Steroidobacter agaridevorans]|uniref:Uncharacterized protein n=2 Tax=Steroidobacter agaridevorans TaxID=2695856 RepID=A0A829YFW1_9GAMM|nr:hypothetical protein GCM10011487_37180 [Steroidobacter agaridevorans]
MSPDLLPSILEIRRITQSLAMLDAILCPEWEYRYYSFNSGWGPGEEMASMRTGEGDDWFLLIYATGAAIKGFAHELADDLLLPQNIQAQVPPDFASFLSEPAFSMQQATFCYWRRTNDSSWSKVSSALTDDGSDDMLKLVVSDASAYKEWAEGYYEIPVSLNAVAALFSHQPLNDSVIRALNPDAAVNSVYAEASEIGYPY